MKSQRPTAWLTAILAVIFALLFFYFSRTTCMHPHCVEQYSQDYITILYGCYLAFLVISAVVCMLTPQLPYKIRHLLEREVNVSPCRSALIRFWWPEGSVLEGLVMLGVLGLITGNFIVYWNLMLEDTDQPVEPKDYWVAALMATGHMADVLLGLVLIPLGRNSFLPILLDIQIDAALRFHKRCGILISIVTIAHGAVIWTKATTFFNPPSYVYWTFNIGVEGPKWIFYVSNAGFMVTFGFIAGAALLILWIFTFPTIRRKVYHLFYGIHLVFGPIMIIAACLHTSSIWYYCMPGIFLLLTDWCTRLCNYTAQTRCVASREACGYIRIDIFSKMKVNPGGFVMLRISELGLQMSHPFTVAHDPASDRLIVFVKPSMLPGKWSSRLGSLVPYDSCSKGMTAQIDGPFGHLKFNCSQMDAVVCFVGGVGVAGALAIAADVLSNATQTSKVFLFWAARELAASHLTVLQQLRARGSPRLNIYLYGRAAAILPHQHSIAEERLVVDVTADSSVTPSIDSIKHDIQLAGIRGSIERMVPATLLRQEVIPAICQFEKIGVYTCGPKDLMDSVQQACMQVAGTFELYLHRETFEW